MSVKSTPKQIAQRLTRSGSPMLAEIYLSSTGKVRRDLDNYLRATFSDLR